MCNAPQEKTIEVRLCCIKEEKQQQQQQSYLCKF
jgi:hypothetical protein